MSLGCLRCFVWICLIYISNQYREEGSDVNYLNIANSSMRKNVSYSGKPHPNNCACHNRDGMIFNLAPLQNTDGTPSFTVNSTKYPGHSYSYNPCSSFKLGPKNGCCQTDVAICWWIPNGSPDTYDTIGNQDKAKCKGQESKIPSLIYTSTGEYKHRKANVTLKCDEKKREKDEAIFEILDEDNWIFQLTHLCSCGDGCPINPPTTTTTADPSDPMRVVIPVAVAASAVTTLVLVPLLVWLLGRRQNRNNNDDERQRLLGNGAVERVRNPIPEGNPIPERNPIAESSAGCSQGSSRNESDVNTNSANV